MQAYCKSVGHSHTHAPLTWFEAMLDAESAPLGMLADHEQRTAQGNIKQACDPDFLCKQGCKSCMHAGVNDTHKGVGFPNSLPRGMRTH